MIDNNLCTYCLIFSLQPKKHFIPQNTHYSIESYSLISTYKSQLGLLLRCDILPPENILIPLRLNNLYLMKGALLFIQVYKQDK